jgi:dihydroflavonol-4-reductase
MQALVTGANGHVGNDVCRALVERGHGVRASVRSLGDPAKSAPLSGVPQLDIIELEVRDAARFEAAVDGVELLLHVAATYALSTGSREKDEERLRDSLEGGEDALLCLSNARPKAGLGSAPSIQLETSLADTLGTLPKLRAAEARRGARGVPVDLHAARPSASTRAGAA